MSTITASMVKDLRERTGAGMMDCKTALTETKGDIEAAIAFFTDLGLTIVGRDRRRPPADLRPRPQRHHRHDGAGAAGVGPVVRSFPRRLTTRP